MLFILCLLFIRFIENIRHIRHIRPIRNIVYSRHKLTSKLKCIVISLFKVVHKLRNLIQIFQSGRGKISLEEFRAMANRDTCKREAPSDCFKENEDNLEDDI